MTDCLKEQISLFSCPQVQHYCQKFPHDIVTALNYYHTPMTVHKCDLCLREISNNETTVHIGRKILGGIALCAECGKPASDFLESIEPKLEKNPRL